MPRVVVPQLVEDPAVSLEHAQVADREIGGDGYGRRVVQQRDPAHEKADGLVERGGSEARAAGGVGQGRCALGVVESGRDEDEPREDEGDRRQAQGERRGDAEGVIDARADVAVARREQRAGAQGARELGGTPDDHPKVSQPAAAPGDRLTAHASPRVIDRPESIPGNLPREMVGEVWRTIHPKETVVTLEDKDTLPPTAVGRARHHHNDGHTVLHMYTHKGTPAPQSATACGSGLPTRADSRA